MKSIAVLVAAAHVGFCHERCTEHNVAIKQGVAAHAMLVRVACFVYTNVDLCLFAVLCTFHELLRIMP